MVLNSAPRLNFNEDLTPIITFEKPHIRGLGRRRVSNPSKNYLMKVHRKKKAIEKVMKYVHS